MLKSCLSSLREHAPEIQVILVEHETTEGSDWVRQEMPEVVVLQAKDTEEKKQSYSSLNNLGASSATGEYLLLINNDIVVRAGAVQRMVQVLDELPDVGICGAKLLTPDSLIQHIGVCFNGFGIPYHLGWGKENAREFQPAFRDDYYDAVTFAAAMIRRPIWDEVEGLCEDYFFNYEDMDFCLKVREKGYRCFMPHEAVMMHMEAASREFRTTKEHTIGHNLWIFGEKWIRNDRMAKALKVTVEKGHGPLAAERLNIAFVPSGRHVGVAWWRMHLPAKKIAEKRLANVQVIYGDMAEDGIKNTMSLADLAIWQGFYNEPVKRMAELGSGRSHRMIYEYDDHPIYLSPFAQAFRGLGTKEIPLRASDGSEIWLWRDGQDGFNLEANRQNRQRQLEIMSAVDAITTTTDPLAGYFKTLNQRVFAIPNCIDFTQYQPMSDFFDRKPGPIRIGWWGGDNHWHDISMVGQALTKYVNAHDVRLVLIGAFYKGPFKGIDLNKVEERPWVHVEAFPHALAAAGLDVVFIPLASPALPEMRFNAYKSEIKWLEASALKLPALVQGGVRAYENVQEGVTGLYFNDDDEFLEKLDQLVRGADLRRKMGQTAYDWAREHRDLDKEINRWMECYEKIAAGAFEARVQKDELWNELTEAAADRPAASNIVAEGAGRA